MLAAGIQEWQQSAAKRRADVAGMRDRLSVSMGSAVSTSVDAIADKLNILATIGSVSPFVGLFGTVWGIMNSFIGISKSQTTNLAVVAPGIAEALLATAIGLVAAIPAAGAYNILSGQVARYAQQLESFAGEFITILSRQLEEQS